jgi:hypothetical protein
MVADSVKIQAMSRNGARYHIAHAIVEVILRRNCEVPHNATLIANKVIVLFNGRVVPVKSFTEIEFANLRLRSKDVEVSVDRAEGYVRYLLANLLVDPFRSWMRSRPLQNLQDSLPLSASLCSEGLHYDGSLCIERLEFVTTLIYCHGNRISPTLA